MSSHQERIDAIVQRVRAETDAIAADADEGPGVSSTAHSVDRVGLYNRLRLVSPADDWDAPIDHVQMHIAVYQGEWRW